LCNLSTIYAEDPRVALHLLRALDILREQSPPQLPHIRVTRLLTFCLQIGPYFDGGPRVIGSDRVAFQSLFDRPDGRLKKRLWKLGLECTGEYVCETWKT